MLPFVLDINSLFSKHKTKTWCVWGSSSLLCGDSRIIIFLQTFSRFLACRMWWRLTAVGPKGLRKTLSAGAQG